MCGSLTLHYGCPPTKVASVLLTTLLSAVRTEEPILTGRPALAYGPTMMLGKHIMVAQAQTVLTSSIYYSGVAQHATRWQWPTRAHAPKQLPPKGEGRTWRVSECLYQRHQYLFCLSTKQKLVISKNNKPTLSEKHACI